MKQAKAHHQRMKLIRGRGQESQTHAAALLYLRELECEHAMIGDLLLAAWSEIGDDSRDWRKFLRHSDAAQQRLHRALKRLVFHGKQ